MRESSSSPEAGEQTEQPTQTSVHGVKEHPDKPSLPKRLWAKLGLDLGTILIMIKAAVPQTIAIAMYQASSVADTYSTLGYLVAIASVLGFAIMPRAKFIQTMLLNILAVCIGTAVALLAIWTAVQARKHTTPAGASAETYNSSASAVCAIWLFFQVYLVNSIRSARPQLQFPAILYSIFVNVAMTYGPQFPDMSAGISFAERLLEAFLTGFALATGVSLFFIPITQRNVVFKEFTGYLQGLRQIMKTQISYTSSLEHVDMFRSESEKSDGTESDPIKPGDEQKKGTKNSDTKEANALKEAIEGVRGLHAKLSADMIFAKREMAYGKLRPSDLSELMKLLRACFLPLLGMSSLIDIFNRVASNQGWDRQDREVGDRERKAVQEWQAIMKTLHEPLSEVGGAIEKALEHVLLRLELIKPPKKSKMDDTESRGDSPSPGSNEFAIWLDHKVKDFYASRKVTLRQWCEQKGIALPKNSFETQIKLTGKDINNDDYEGSRDQKQLYLVLYIEYLLYAASRGVFDLVSFADNKVSDGTMKSNRVIVPGYRRITKWIKSAFSADEDVNTSSYVAAMDGAEGVYLGEAFQERKDPEHLPARNKWEALGNAIRVIPHLLRSDHSVFGFRVACATLSIGIVAYLRDTYEFFVQQRLVWAMIMVAISMTRTSGQSLFNFTLRVFGTLCAMVASYLVYYIPDGHTAGIIVFLFIWEVLCFYIVVKMPRFVVVGIISAVTVILIIGYELQVRVLGVAVAESSGQPAYSINVLAPYRLACVAGGLAVAWVWTIFPFPVTEHSEIRKDSGAAIYLLANFYAIVHETVGARVRGDEGDPSQKNSPAAKLEIARQKVFSKELLLIDKLKMFSGFSKWEVALGGKFPRETYDTLIQSIQSILSYSAVISYASKSFYSDDESVTEWQRDFRYMLGHVKTTSHDITSRLCLLSSSMANGTPIPPYLPKLEPYALTENLKAIDTDILSVKHIAEPGYAAFAVMQVAGRSVVSEINKLTELVKELVGELDFSFHVIDTSSTSGTSYQSSSGTKGKHA